jgi:hypothetical protein
MYDDAIRMRQQQTAAQFAITVDIATQVASIPAGAAVR